MGLLRVAGIDREELVLVLVLLIARVLVVQILAQLVAVVGCSDLGRHVLCSGCDCDGSAWGLGFLFLESEQASFPAGRGGMLLKIGVVLELVAVEGDLVRRQLLALVVALVECVGVGYERPQESEMGLRLSRLK